MSLLENYEQRTAWKAQPIQGTFPTGEGLKKKVSETGTYAPFPGTTVVFRPEKFCYQVVDLMQRRLFQSLERWERQEGLQKEQAPGGPTMLAAPLPSGTIHMTLHDLTAPGRERPEGESLSGHLGKAVKIVSSIQRDFAGQKISMVADRIVNMVSQSLVLLLRPATEGDYEMLLQMYDRFEELVKLPYPLTPHITLAYFKPGMIYGDVLEKAVEDCQIVPETAPVFTFYPEALTVQVFRDMQSYLDIPHRLCLSCDGGINRSVIASHLLNALAQERGLPVCAQPRGAYEGAAGYPTRVDMLKRLRIEPDPRFLTSRYLKEEEVSWFSSFGAISAGAMHRFDSLCIPKEKREKATEFFFGVPDPEYGDISFEGAFNELYPKTVHYLDAFEQEVSRYWAWLDPVDEAFAGLPGRYYVEGVE